MIYPHKRSETAPQRIPVLVVDDDSRVRAALRATINAEQDLELIGEASGAPAALAIALESPSFVALVDITVRADGSGLALVQMLAQRPGCKVIAMSVRSGYRAAARAAGASDFIEKGDDIGLLLSAIRTAADTPTP